LGTLVREPHNSFISIVARLGVIGMGAWLWMHFELLRAWLSTLRRARRLRMANVETLLLMTLAFAVLVLLNAVGEDAFEKPYYAIPYYCLWGIALRVAYTLRMRPAMQPRMRPQPPAPEPALARGVTGVRT